jgi:hypothetical protein
MRHTLQRSISPPRRDADPHHIHGGWRALTSHYSHIGATPRAARADNYDLARVTVDDGAQTMAIA